MKQTFKLKNGEISFDKEGISIIDNAKKQYLIRVSSSFLWTLFGIITFLRYMKTGDQFLLWSGLLLGISHFIILVITLFRSTKNSIKTNEIKSLEIKQRFGNKFLDINLNGNKVRRVNEIEGINHELSEYIAVNFNQTKN